ncbi:class I SAM-dependent methyltransferase [Chitinophaga flava]|uniref:Methyltransferase type 11 n=1 Tax=Chitinophaga flava TaxID=2259036 RepID=A0A365XUT1_9BACT|nr:methyltransferase domain-containing protein [Chitinophaga flava]RBL89781.1 methyltransferase type 11 [Chitinophaga flava]
MVQHKLYVQYGCGPFSAPEGWKNFDSSPTLRLQQLPLIGNLLKRSMHVAFHPNVILGDILKGLPGVGENSCDGIYCSHVLEHLSYHDCKKALQNTYQLLKPGGYFRCVVPDLESAVKHYTSHLNQQDPEANVKFLDETLLGKRDRTRGMKQLIQSAYGNREHLYMWDRLSLSAALQQAGFQKVRSCAFNDSKDRMFERVEEASRFNNAVALEATK